MPAYRKHLALKQTVYTSAHVFQLLVGHDFFSDAFGDPSKPEVLERMKQAWSDPGIRRQVYDLMEARRLRGHQRTKPWAEEQFRD